MMSGLSLLSMIELIYSFLKVLYNLARVCCGPTIDKVTDKMKSKAMEKADAVEAKAREQVDKGMDKAKEKAKEKVQHIEVKAQEQMA